MRLDIYSFQIVMGDGWSVGSQMQRVLVVNSIYNTLLRLRSFSCLSNGAV